MENKTIDNQKLKKLYEESLEKWEEINNEFRILEFFNFCSFCREQLKKGYEFLDVEGECEGCKKCLIDKNICGSESSLLSELSHIESRMSSILNNIICNLSEHINILNKDIKK